MNTTYKTSHKLAIALVLIILCSYFFSILLLIILPKEKPQTSQKQNISNDLAYKNFDFKSAFRSITPQIALTKVVQKTKIPASIPPSPMILPPPPIVLVELKEEPSVASTLSLMAIFDMGKGKGFVTLNEKGNRESFILSVGEEFKGLKLTKVLPLYAMFKQNDIEYKLELHSNSVVEYRPNKPIEKPILTVQIPNETVTKPAIKMTNNKIEVERNLLESYTKDTDKIWRDISIKENLVNDKIDGFKVDKIKKDSNFEKLGIRTGDIIKNVNGVDLKSYDDAVNMFKKLGKISTLNMKIKRGNEIMELNYDIK